MAKTNNLTDFLIDLADSIREIEGSSDAINPQDFHDRIINSQPTIYNGETELLVPSVSGVWKFNETVSIITDNIYELINFTSNGIIYPCFKTSYMPSDNYISLFYDDNEGTALEVYTAGWNDEVYRTIDFGTEPQEVSEDFYTWFIANAVKQ